MTNIQEKMKSMKINSKITHKLKLVDKEFKIAVKTMFKDIKENMLLMNAQIGNLSREIETT